MRLWTVQNIGAYDKLLKDGTLRGDWRRAERFFKHAYRWLCAQMESRGISLNGRCPIWAWGHKPDFRSEYRGTSGVVRLEIEVPDEIALPSSFEAWHCVLNDHYLTTSNEELDRAFARPCGYTREEIEASWEKIFDLAYCKKHRYGNTVQVTFPHLENSYVKKLWVFPERRGRDSRL